jgi:hypothetical protein
MASRPVEITPPDDTAFADAFAAASAADTPPALVPPVETPPVEPPAAAPPVEAAPAEAPPVEPPAAAPAAEVPPVEPPAAAPPVEAPPAASADDIVKGLADLLKQQPAAAPAQEPVPAPVPARPIYTTDETRILDDYEKNWPDVAAAESLKRRAEYHDLLKYMFTEVSQYVSPLMEQMRAMGNAVHTGELRQLVPEYSEAVEADVNGWINTQPSYLQTGMKQVMQTGTTEEVADLIGRYRSATGPAPAAVPAAVPPSSSKTELSSAAKQAAESLAPVSSDRSQVPAGQDPMDFTSAFARYAAESTKI